MPIRNSPSLTSLIKGLALIFVISVALNYAWELIQARFFFDMTGWANMWWHCFVASLGDGLIVWIIYVAGWSVTRRRDWYVSPGLAGYGAMLATGSIIAIAVEWIAVHVLDRWTYTPSMPIIPVLNIGIVPVLQMLVLPPVIFYLSAVWRKRKWRAQTA